VPPHKDSVYRFGVFEFDVRNLELRKSGVKLKLQDQPRQVLVRLLERPRELVSREELRSLLWPEDTFVGFETGLNTAVKRLRETLGDSADHPTFIETIPRRGYKFIAPVSTREDVVEASLSPDAKGHRIIWNPSTLASYKVLRWRLVLLVVSAIFIVLISGKVWFQRPLPPRVLGFTQLTHDGQLKWWSNPLASDGSRIYFTERLPDQRTLILQVPLKGGEVVPLPLSLDRPIMLDLSRDGSELLVGAGDDGHSSLWIQPVTGGSARRVGTIVAADARLAADGTRIIYTGTNFHDVYSVNLDGSSPRRLFTVDGLPNSFQFSPDGRRIRFTKFDPVADRMTIMEAAADGTGLHEVQPGAWGRWTSDARFFIFQTRHADRLDLWALREEKRFLLRNTVEQPVHLTAGPMDFFQPLPSKDGKQIFAVGKTKQAEVIRYDAHTGQFVPYFFGISAEGLAFSRDGQWVTYASYPDGMLWRCKVDGTERLQLTFPPLHVVLPRWSPDGRQIAFNAFVADADRKWGIYLISSNGGTAQPILPGRGDQVDVNWFPDGKSIIFGSPGLANTPIYTLDLHTKSVSSLSGANGLFAPRISPDGRQVVALTSARPFRLMLFDISTEKWTEVPGSGYGYPSWSRDGKYVYFREAEYLGGDNPSRILRVRVRDRHVENVVEEKNVGRMTTGTIGPWLGLAPDDSPLFARDIGTQEIYALDVDLP